MSVLFQHVTVLTMDPAQPLLKDAYVAVEGTTISFVGTTRPQGEFDRVVDGAGQVLMPGLINCHTHVPMTLMRGYGGGCDLQHWLQEYIFPAEAKLDERAVAAGTALGLAEMIASGVTCIADMYMHTDMVAQRVLSSGISANLSCGGLYFGDPKDFSPDKCSDCRNQEELMQQWHGAGDGQILVDASIHAEYTSSAPLWQWTADFAQKNKLGMHVHISETKLEHEQSLQRHGKTPLAILDQYGVWERGGTAAHCVWVSDEDMDLMARKHVTAVHNPVSNLKLGSGVAQVPKMLEVGVNVALGTDGVSSNNNADLFEEIKLAAMLHKGVSRDPMVVTAHQALEMATVNAARALYRNTGVVAPGKVADLILVDFNRPNLVPCHDVEENLVFSARGSDVSMNMARGKIIYEKGEFLTLDLEKIRSEVEHYALPLIFG
mgnify:CR=1 FL=1